MIATLSKQGGRRYPQMGTTASVFVGWLLSVGAAAAPPPPDSPLNFAVLAPPASPTLPAYDWMPRDPQVDNDFFALARMAATQSYLEDVEQWMNDELGANEELVNVFEDESLDPDDELFGKKL